MNPTSLLKTSSEAMKQHVQECYEELHMALQEDEKAVLDMIEQDRRETNSKLNRILQDWNQHLGLLQKHISTMQSAQQSPTESMKEVTVKDQTWILCCCNNLVKTQGSHILTSACSLLSVISWGFYVRPSFFIIWIADFVTGP